MTDIHSREIRSFNMSRVRGKNTKPEMLVRKFMFANGLRYILHDKRLPGKPDLVFPKLKTVIFVNGCFWHGHKLCKYFSIPKTRSEWWTSKIESNITRDSVNQSALEQAGWKVLTIWECQLRIQHRDIFLNNLLREMNTP
ncbi:DNA mismatch endonuclease (patch repair protein) [Dyadobacter sp. BE34]|uniref:Very short patch repair endonuclease n=1 Tax=Dyadobacter fermentans TaxID=94254 RepID=A0ABU1R2B1_9BACT|nr:MULTISPECIES: very short patch repair endonuclease [Dyadobacter]MDR6807525.1 DNA mismatch endonuclease (patch repair protein) [Dyadobacter fermentans]MDR7045266.1 DNA mismatch endonuclease (patch repair protein) [Dyadobacter sp. BE242]MDR7199579.1 DNA mismatch endonuclease (patch repair protein) [Dyadobacter sp. BE34]MDR7217962.1 DNA mismatch endonuclease (patch repair protein) [Dyadobacter sp. BE31]MDR7265470.1 DNA mismatch endonuclease (patch repair protein) [Dyadobacter sp. BE32]